MKHTPKYYNIVLNYKGKPYQCIADRYHDGYQVIKVLADFKDKPIAPQIVGKRFDTKKVIYRRKVIDIDAWMA